MRSVVLCEGSDDLWFIGYYIHKVGKWIQTEREQWCDSYEISTIKNRRKTQDIIYMCSPDKEHSTAICSVGGQDAFEEKITQISTINKSYPNVPIDAIIIFRDCDDRNCDLVVASMNKFFEEFSINLHNHSISEIIIEYDEYPLKLYILPVVVPFDEAGAIETLIMKSIKERCEEDAIVVDYAKDYIDRIVADDRVISYLTKQRQIIKAKFSATVAVRNPTHSTALFGDMALTAPFEESNVLRNHMYMMMRLISGIFADEHSSF